MSMTYDFGGYATRNDLKCSDGITIRRNAFKNNDGKRVSLVWNHQHDDPENVLGHADLENREDGVYAYCSFNDTPKAQTAKEIVRHGDVKALSIFANKLKKKGGDVYHGDIKEVSLVLAGANPGAFIDELVIAHSDEMPNDSAVIWIDPENDGYFIHSDSIEVDDEEYDDEEDLEHSDDDKTIEDVYESMSDEQKKVVQYMVGMALEENGLSHADTDTEDDEETVQDVYNNMSDKQKKVVAFMIGMALEENKNDNEEKEEMKHNVFSNAQAEDPILMHSEFINDVLADAKKYGTLRESYLRHGEEDPDTADELNQYGISNISELYPEPHLLNTPPELISRRMDWVTEVTSKTHKTPFSRIKSMFADITEDEARAKGYIKGKRKKEEVFSVLKRQTIPTTIYKKQKLDRDDILDISSFDVVRWMRAEMEVMLDEEIARAILIGDGRSKLDEDHINDECIRPIWTDDDLFSVKATITVAKSDPDSVKADKFIEGIIKNRKHYKGSGNPVLFTTEDRLTSMQLLKDANGRYIYDSIEKIANILRVSKIVTVPVMEGLTRTPDRTNKVLSLEGIIVNMADYNVGKDKNGEKNFFDDFDIDYNQMKYLIETRMSGALIKPYSAIVVEFDDGTTTV